MRVDGSSNPVEFCVNSSPDYDIYIRNMAIVISDAGAELDEFGNLSSLTNGIDIKWISQDLGDLFIAEGLKSNFDFVQMALGQPAFGNGTSSFRANNVVASSEAYVPVIDLSKTFGLPWGVRLRKGTNDRLCFIIKDNITSVDRFDCVSYGITF